MYDKGHDKYDSTKTAENLAVNQSILHNNTSNDYDILGSGHNN